MNLKKNLRTTLIGLGSGVGILFFSGIQAGLGVKEALVAAALAALGVASKDAD